MDDLLRDFIAEAREGIEALDSELVRFEQNPENPELLGEIFRLIHTIKGTCGFIGLARLQAVAHAAETVLGGFRDQSVPVSGEAVSAVLEAVDVIRAMIEELSRTGVEAPGDDRPLIERLDACMRPEAAAPAAAPEGPSAAPGPQAAPAAAAPAPAIPRALLERVGGEAALDAACEMSLERFGRSELLTAVFGPEPGLALQGGLRDALTAAARGFGDAAHLKAQLQAFASVPLRPAHVAAVLELVATQLQLLEADPEGVAELVRLVAPAPEAASGPEPQADAEPRPSTDAATLAPVLEVEPPADVPAASPVEAPAEAPAPLVQIVAAPKAPAASGSAAEAEPVGQQTIRVSVDSLEHLMTVASELVLIRNQLLQILRLETESPFEAPLHRLNQVTSELQEGVMTTRMQPISGAWAKLPRLVRDLCKDLGKKIDLQLEGQDTELDRQVLELIKDPLTHMIRNAADHGIETPAQRRELGKPETGKILVSARHEGGAIVIEMIDDGRGLNASKIKAKALSSGVVTPQQLENLSDQEAQRLIFLPGFSTAAEVTAVSGRGVGMDVVRTNIEKIGGAIELESEEGRGSHFTIRIPLTLTIVSALIVECCGERFAMPQSSVIELVSASDASLNTIEYINGAAVLRLRDRLLPLVSLQSVLDLPPENARRGETCIVVARVGSFTFGVIVDRVFDTEEIVVKPVATVLRHLKAYSGATILGDGSVIMILDFKGISPDAGATRAAAAAETEDRAEEARAAMLLFQGRDGGLKAAPLASVARIEEVASDAIESVQGRSVLQYRGRLMPVVGLDGGPVASSSKGMRPLLVFVREDQAIGLLVEEIVDIVESTMQTELKPTSGGSLGSLIIEGRATELIDVDHFWRLAMNEAQPHAALPPPVQETPLAALKRLLVLDQSPFCHLLLRPLLARAGYDVTVAGDPAAALSLHERGERFDLIVADAALAGPEAKQFASALARASNWHGAPLLSLGLQTAKPEEFDETAVLDAVSERLFVEPGLRGAA